MDYPLLPRQMPERIKNVWYKNIYLVMGPILLVGIVAVGLLIGLGLFKGIWFWLSLAYLIVTALVTVLLMSLVPYRYAFHRYEITEEDIAYSRGYIFRTTTFVPMNRIQHVLVEQGPLMRQEKLMGVVVNTAATSHYIANLNVEDATALRSQIMALVKVAKEDV